MKKLKLFTKKRFLLVNLGLAVTSSLILVACGQNTSNSAGVNSSNNGRLNNPQIPNLPNNQRRATEPQQETARSLLREEAVKTVLRSQRDAAVKIITANFDSVARISLFVKNDVKESIETLKNESTTNTQSPNTVIDLVATLKTAVTATGSKISIDKQSQATAFLDLMTQKTTDLLDALNNLPESSTTNSLSTLNNEFFTALTNLATANNTNWTIFLETFLNIQNRYQTRLNELSPNLQKIQTSAFELDSVTASFEKFINNEAPAFLLNGDKASASAEHIKSLVSKVRNKVLGEQGADLWNQGDAPETIVGNEKRKKSTKIYSIVAGLANKNKAWAIIEEQIKVVTFNQALLLNDNNAINLLALYAQENVPLDAARLNAFLVNEKSNPAHLLQTSTNNQGSIVSILQKLSTGLDRYETVLGNTTNSKLLTDLTELVQELQPVSTETADTTKNSQITNIQKLKTASATLINKYQSFKNEWNKLQPILWKKSGEIINFPLLDDANTLNQAIGLASEYGHVLQVVGHAKELSEQIQKITQSIQPTSTDATKTNESVLMKLLDGVISELKSDGAFAKVVEEFAKVTDWDNKIKTKAQAIAKSENSQTSGYLYDLLIKDDTTENKAQADASASMASSSSSSSSSQTATVVVQADTVTTAGQGAQQTPPAAGTTPTDPVQKSTQLSLPELKTELTKLQSGSDKQLTVILNLLNQQFNLSNQTQTQQLSLKLALMFNSGRVLN
ncbi:hypothetical protein J2Z62_000129 [Mycoplasmoides fastidiosum]|uniref:Lipoprotein n=1 Tax=Mycoplasmoides fastidiosum TaxID=92758 RepID=A0ABU0LY98_9BACT|nr:hypothetical protein [Mycoplasmoides fastidiosum]MDQ0513691.1 hypothetical protein [Mycoplasmoides fastidiosum]UUD37886.1 hypothetical protein NPA10_00615 [Mycoplasmoides fastidiosum]